MDDPYRLERFVIAQNPVIEQVVAELRAGQKRTHWMWYVFPQIRGLGHSAMAQRFAIAIREEAEAYLRHPVLGPRIEECTGLVNLVQDRSIEQIFGYPDDLKFLSSMTLFMQVAPEDSIFEATIKRYFNGRIDGETLKQLGLVRPA